MSHKSSAVCPIKAGARQETIIDFYHDHFGRSCIPDHKQYWTLAGPCYSPDTKKLGEYAEPIQMVESGLIEPRQYRGVEMVQDIIEQNRRVLPDYEFIEGEFVDVLKTHKGFNPEVIYVDTVNMHRQAIHLLTETLHAVNRSGATDVLVVINMIWKNPYGGFDKIEPQEMADKLMESARFVHAYRDSWSLHQTVKAYPGTGKSKTEMLNLFLTKK